MQYEHPLVEELLLSFKTVIGADYERYRNHVYRVFLNCLLLDKEKLNEEKYAIAAVFHDIGIWTNHTIDYLDPSVEQARIYLGKIGREDLIPTISRMINWHHKISRYKGEDKEITENFRKADWIDVSLGMLRFGVSGKTLKGNRRLLPNRGFHFFLVRKITKNFLRHPLNPFPMFRK